MKRKGSIIAILIMASSGYGIWHRFLRVPEMPSDIKGIDISNRYAGSLDWSRLGEHDDFVILRAVGMTYSGKSFIDTNFKRNWESLRNYDPTIPRGAYIRFASKTDAVQQFEIFKSIVNLRKGDLPPIIDVEEDVRKEEVVRWIELAKAHYKTTPILYDNYNRHMSRKHAIKGCKLWIYLNPGVPIESALRELSPAIWQYRQNVYIPGFGERHTDLNRFMGDSTAFKELLIR